MPNNPTAPPPGTYSSTGNGDSSWDGTFTYNSDTKEISFTRNNAHRGPFPGMNQDHGNAINFTIYDGIETAHFVSHTFAWKGNYAEYKGKWNIQGKGQVQDGWTATQTS